MQIEFFAPLGRAWGRTKEILFRPFMLETWLVMGFAAWLANLFHGGSFGVNGNFHRGGHHPSIAFHHFGAALGRFMDKVAASPGTLMLLVFGGLLVLMIAVALLWVSSRAKLVFLDNAVTGNARIVEPWKRLGPLGDSLFLWRLAFGLISVLTMALLAAGAVGLGVLGAAGMPGFIHRGILFFVFLGIAVMLAAILLLFIRLWVESFIIPVMYRFNLSVLGAWKAFLPWLQEYAGAFVVYNLFVILLAVVAGMCIVALGLMTCCIGWLILALPYVGTVILLPVWITYRLLGPIFLEQLNPDFAIIAAHDREATRAES